MYDYINFEGVFGHPIDAERMCVFVDDESLERKRARTLLDALEMPQESREWLLEQLGGRKAAIEAIIGQEDAEWLTSYLYHLRQDPDNYHLLPLGESDEYDPEDPLYAEPRNVRKMAAIEQRRTHRTTEERRNPNVWYDKEQDQYSEITPTMDNQDREQEDFSGFMIPYLRRYGAVQTTRKGEKILNINVTRGLKPSLRYTNISLKLQEVDVSEKVVELLEHLHWKFRYEMSIRDSKIQTCLNGKFWVYYRTYWVLEENISFAFTVFSPMVMDDLSDRAKEDILKRLSESKAKKAKFEESRRKRADRNISIR